MKDRPGRQTVAENIDNSGAWAFFDGASQGVPQVCKTEGVIFLKESHSLKFKAGSR